MFKKLFLFFGILLLESCAVGYQPTALNTPFYKNEGDIQISLAGSQQTLQNGSAELQASFAFRKHLCAMANVQAPSGFNADAGIGVHYSLLKTILFEGFVGAGGGKINNQTKTLDSFNLFAIKSGYEKLFFQPGFAIAGKKRTIGFAYRINLVQLNKYEVTYKERKSTANTETVSMDAKMITRFEPTIIYRQGANNFKWFVQAGLSNSRADAPTYFDTSPQKWFVNAGIQLQIHTKPVTKVINKIKKQFS